MVATIFFNIVAVKIKGRTLSLKNANFVVHFSMLHKIYLEAMVKSARYFGKNL
jgi:hypothetical protein